MVYFATGNALMDGACINLIEKVLKQLFPGYELFKSIPHLVSFFVYLTTI